MKGPRLLLILALVAVVAVSGLGAALAAPAPQLPPGEHRGMFGTVTAVGADSITLETAQGATEVKVDQNSKFRMPGKDEATLADVEVGDRLALLASKQGDVLTALMLMVVPGQPQNQHKTGVITNIKGVTITITDKDGNTFTLDVPGNAAGLALGKLITGVVRHDPKTGKPIARELHEVGKVIERLTENVRKAEKDDGRRGSDREKDLERLRKALDDTVTRQQSILREVMERVPDQAKPHIKEAMEHARKAHEAALKGLGMKGVHMEVQGGITAIDATASTVTVQPRRGDALVLKATGESRIHKDDNEHATLADLEVGDTVLAVRFNPDTKEIVRLVAKTPRSLEASGIISAVNPEQGTVAVLAADRREPLTLTVNDTTQVMLDGAAAGISSLLVGQVLDRAEFTEGTLVATRLVVLSLANAVGHAVAFAGTIDSFTDTQVVVSGQKVTTNAQTHFKGRPQVGAAARVEAIVQADASLLALELNVSQRRGPPEGQKQSTRFTGTVESFTPNEAMVSGRKVVINDRTEVKGALQVGATVRVEGTLQPDGSVLAEKIDLRTPEEPKPKDQKADFSGTIESITPTQWVVSGKKVNIDAQTRVEARGILQVGAVASVEGTLQADGSVLAKKIEVRPARPTPGQTPTATSTPTPAPTPAP